MTAALERSFYSTAELENRRPDGVAISMSSILAYDAGDRYGAYRMADIYPWSVAPLYRNLEGIEVRTRSSVATDVRELVHTGRMSRFLLERLVPWLYGQEIDASASDSYTASFAESCLGGSDLDWRLGLSSNDMQDWSWKLVMETIQQFEVNGEKINVAEGNSITTVTIPVNTVINTWPRGKLMEMYRRTHEESSILTRDIEMMDSLHSYPAIEISFGVWPGSNIPFCDYKLVATRDEGSRLTLIEIGLAPQPEYLSPQQQVGDTRTGDTVNSWDNIFPLATNDLASMLPCVLGQDGGTLTSSAYTRRYRDVEQEVEITPSGLVVPHLGGVWEGGKYIYPGGGKPWVHGPLELGIPGTNRKIVLGRNRQRHDVTEMFMFLSPQELEILSRPVEFGRDFGTAVPEAAFVEFLRVGRKADRYGKISQDEKTEYAFDIIRSEVLVGGRTLVEHLRKKAGEGTETGWQMDAKREAATSLFYAPQEFIERGEKARLGQYLPNWRYLAKVKDELPPREEILEALFTRARLGAFYSEVEDGWREVTARVREEFSDDPDIQARNDLELIPWLVRVDPSRAAREV